ncbi:MULTISPECIES: TetR/AcrR family transcriptional regulator [unclassified Blastococcus]|uniref:TetR/AcrR family transcriptional regulator n=1 Tax=unclassified Blastococcus TaxID=2619396 RepID=UPI001909203F|nr:MULTISPECIES: TetR/AcrR family transcriptional regulator [unclassified Blastococcus]
MSDLVDRRAQKKAQTRQLVRTTAHRLFAARGFDCVTIADVAREADVAVQTVFNHFATKEELFFDGRVPWVEAIAGSVIDREPGTTPLTALRSHLLTFMTGQLRRMGSAEERSFRATIQASETLRTYNRLLVLDAERRLSDALLEAWESSDPDDPTRPLHPAIAAPLTAAIWLSVVRVLVVENRLRIMEGLGAAEAAAAVEQIGQRLFARLQDGSDAINDLVAPDFAAHVRVS